jgi:thiol:disulfide interchange protein DsbD
MVGISGHPGDNPPTPITSQAFRVFPLWPESHVPMVIPVVAATIALLTGTVAVPSTPTSSDEPAQRHAKVMLVAEHTQLVPGSTAYLGLHFKIEPHWHTYWLGTPKAEGQLEFTLDLPAGATLGPIQWPAPKRLVSEGDILDHVYENEVTLILPVSVPSSAKPGPATITGTAKYLICNTTCVFEESTLTLTLPVVAAGAKPVDSPSAALFRAARSRLPKPLPSTPSAPSVARLGTSFVFDASGAAGLSFFPAADCLLLADLIPSAHADKPRLSLTPEAGADASAPLRGILEVRYADARGTQWFTIEPTSVTKATPASSPSPQSPH